LWLQLWLKPKGPNGLKQHNEDDEATFLLDLPICVQLCPITITYRAYTVQEVAAHYLFKLVMLPCMPVIVQGFFYLVKWVMQFKTGNYYPFVRVSVRGFPFLLIWEFVVSFQYI
jgi:hypothetical protein